MGSIAFVLVLQLIPICMIVFMISGIIQFFLPNIKLPLIMLFLYIIGSMYFWNNRWLEEWILFTIVAASSFLAIALGHKRNSRFMVYNEYLGNNLILLLQCKKTMQ